MKNRDSAKTYGMIGALLIIVAYLLWAFVMPGLSKQSGEKTVDSVITQTPAQRQENPTVPITDSPTPRP